MANHEQLSGQVPYFFEMNGQTNNPNKQSEVITTTEAVVPQRELTKEELDALINYEYELSVVNSNQ